MMAMNLPFISVVIPTYRRLDRLRLTLSAMELQTLPHAEFEVIVSDDGSGDGTYEAVQDYAASSPLRLKVITGPNTGPAGARNRGIALAQGEWVAMTDDDCVPEPDWLSQLVAYISVHAEVGAIGGGVVRYRDTVISRYVDWTRVMFPPIGANGRVGYLVTANAAVLNEHLSRVNGFDENYKWPGGEDPDLSYRLRDMGVVLGYAPLAMVRHMHRETIKGTYRMFWHHGLGYGAGAVGQQYDVHRSLWYTIRHRMYRGMLRALRERTGKEAVMFAFLEAVRHLAFHRGVRDYYNIAKSGYTSFN